MQTEVLIVLRRLACAFDVVGAICGRYGVVHDIDVEHGVIGATMSQECLREMQAISGVAYVRPVLSFATAA